MSTSTQQIKRNSDSYTVEIEDDRAVESAVRLIDWLCGCGYWWTVSGPGSVYKIGQARSREVAKRRAERFIAQQKRGFRAKTETYEVDAS